MIRTWFSETVAGTPIIAEIMRVDRHLKPLRGKGIPKNMDMHRYILLEWVPINILRRVSGNTSRNTIRNAVEVGIGRNTTAAQIAA